MLHFAVLTAAIISADPVIADLDRFPKAAVCKQALTDHQKFMGEMTAALAAAKDEKQQERLQASLTGATKAKFIWQCLTDARDEKLAPEIRIKHLNDLRKAIGERAYEKGRMPEARPAEQVAPPKDDVVRGKRGKKRGGRKGGCGHHRSSGGCSGGRCAV